jgi:Origin recognition complex subunit 2
MSSNSNTPTRRSSRHSTRASTPLKQVLTPSKRKAEVSNTPSQSAKKLKIATPKSHITDRVMKTCMQVGEEVESGSSDEDEFMISYKFDLASKVTEDKENDEGNLMYTFGKKTSNLEKFMDQKMGEDNVQASERTPFIERTKKELKAAKMIASVTNPAASDEDSLLDETGSEASAEDLKTRGDDDEINLELEDGQYDRFFSDLKISNNATSNNTLSQMPPMTQAEYAECLAKIPEKHVKEKTALHDKYRLYFPQWLLELEYGFSIITYGYRFLIKVTARSATCCLSSQKNGCAIHMSSL